MLIEASDPRTVNVMGLLQHLNTQELKDLLNEDNRLEFIIKDSQTVKNQDSEKEMVLARNKSLAEYNLSWEPKINSGRQRLIELYLTASQLEKAVEAKEKSVGVQDDKISLDTAMAMLQSAFTQAEEESEVLADKFLEHTLDVDTFVEEFQVRRRNAHLRKVKVDKMKELAAKQQQQQTRVASPHRVAPLPPHQPYSQCPAPTPVLGNPHSSLPYSNPTPSSLPYPIFPPNQSAGMPYPVFPTSNIYSPRF